MSKNSIRLLHDLNGLSRAEIEDVYGITIEDDGSVWDSVEGKTFSGLSEWAEYTAEQEEENESFSKFGGKHWYDDD